MFCPDCGAENSRSQKFCTRCGTNLIVIDRAREIVSEMKANAPPPPAPPSSILRIIALISAIGFITITSGTVALKNAGDLPLVFAVGGFAALVMICHQLLQLINPSARAEKSQQAQPVESATSGAGSVTNRTLSGSPTPNHSIIEEPTQQFETERRAN
jgi:hypothetical protein